jgi:hypothetical protein
MALFAFGVQIGLSPTGIVPLANLTNPALQSSLVSLHLGTCARQISCLN